MTRGTTLEASVDEVYYPDTYIIAGFYNRLQTDVAVDTIENDRHL